MRLLCAGLFSALVFLGFAPSAIAAMCRSPTVLLLMPDRQESDFWGPYAWFADAVAESLGVRLQVEFAETNNRSDYMDRLRAALAGPDKPDYVAVLPYFGAVPSMLQEAARHGVSVVTINSELSREDQAAVGQPRERYKNWILQSTADDEKAGYLLAKSVTNVGAKRFALPLDESVGITALGGNQLASSSLHRRDGLNRFVRESGGRARINQYVFTDWSYERGREVAEGLIRRYPDTKAGWAANLPLGLALADAWAAAAAGRPLPAIGMISGPFDARALDGVDDGTFAAVVGGHFLEGGILLALLLDHFNGRDFIDDIGAELRVPFTAVDRANIRAVRAVLGDRDWHGQDFTGLSKCRSRELVHYDFDMDTVLRN